MKARTCPAESEDVSLCRAMHVSFMVPCSCLPKPQKGTLGLLGRRWSCDWSGGGLKSSTSLGVRLCCGQTQKSQWGLNKAQVFCLPPGSCQACGSCAEGKPKPMSQPTHAVVKQVRFAQAQKVDLPSAHNWPLHEVSPLALHKRASDSS